MTLTEAIQQAEAGDLHVMTSLGHYLYETGDTEGAVRWLSAAADGGYVKAMIPAAALIVSEEHVTNLSLSETTGAIDRAIQWVRIAKTNGIDTDLDEQLAELKENIATKMQSDTNGGATEIVDGNADFPKSDREAVREGAEGSIFEKDGKSDGLEALSEQEEDRDEESMIPEDGRVAEEAGDTSQSSQTDERMRACPHCGKPCSEDAQFCRFCGKPTYEEELPVDETLQPEVPAPRTCPTCGASINDDALFCNTCGTEIGEDDGDAPSTMPSSKPEAVPVSSQSDTATDSVSETSQPVTTARMYGMDRLAQRAKDVEYELAEARFEMLKAEREQNYKRQAELKYQVIPSLEREHIALTQAVSPVPVASQPSYMSQPATTQFGATPMPTLPKPSGNPGTGCIVFDIVGMICVMFLPWLSVNMVYASTQISLSGLAYQALNASSQVSSLSSLIGSSSSSQVTDTLSGLGIAAALVVVTVVAMLGVDIAADHNRAKVKTGRGSMALAIAGILVWLIVTAISGTAASSVSHGSGSSLNSLLSGAVSQMIQCTPWVFISICVGIGSFVYHRSVQKKIDIANGVIPATPGTQGIPRA